MATLTPLTPHTSTQIDDASDLNAPLVTLSNNNTLINDEVVDLQSRVNRVSLIGDSSAFSGVYTTYEISNWNEYSTYEISVGDLGLVTDNNDGTFSVYPYIGMGSEIEITIIRDQIYVDTFTVSVTDPYIEKPTITQPSNGTTGIYKKFTITYTGYNLIPAEYTGTRTTTTIEMATDVNFTNIVHTLFGSNTSYAFASSINPNTTYYLRMRHNNSQISSEWSDTVSFTTMASFNATISNTIKRVITFSSAYTNSSNTKGFFGKNGEVILGDSTFYVYNGDFINGNVLSLPLTYSHTFPGFQLETTMSINGIVYSFGNGSGAYRWYRVEFDITDPNATYVGATTVTSGVTKPSGASYCIGADYYGGYVYAIWNNGAYSKHSTSTGNMITSYGVQSSWYNSGQGNWSLKIAPTGEVYVTQFGSTYGGSNEIHQININSGARIRSWGLSNTGYTNYTTSLGVVGISANGNLIRHIWKDSTTSYLLIHANQYGY